ncbi:MAG TPA: IclR family transcriptional regulator [Candidatus Pelethocola excrementipullorum]|nr:IclR family transcriptional regulator [Candidatus Pelethocola excrementipullorum]
MNFLVKKENYNEYSIGLKCFEVGNTYLSSNPFYSMAKDTTAEVSDRSNETAHFAILNGTDVVYLCKYESKQPLRIASHIGKRIPAHATAVGKALLCGFSDEEIRRLYEGKELVALTPNTITSLEMLLDQIRQIRVTQLAYETEESSPYIKCIATPIYNKKGATIAAMSISMPVYRVEENMEQLASILIDAKRHLESILTTLDI